MAGPKEPQRTRIHPAATIPIEPPTTPIAPAIVAGYGFEQLWETSHPGTPQEQVKGRLQE